MNRGAADLDLVTADVRARDRDRYLAVLYAPAGVRPALFGLFGLDLELGSVVAGASEPMLAAIKLAWWRERLIELDSGRVPAQPLLQLLAGAVLPNGVSGAELSELEDRWVGLIEGDDVPRAHVAGGGLLFALAARLLGGNEALGQRLGEAWALGEAGVPGEAGVKGLAALRPLSGLVMLSARDAERARTGRLREPRGSAGRQMRLLASVAFGR